MLLLEQIKAIFVSELNIPLEEYSEDLKYGEVPEWDSASHMVVVLALEDHFGVSFDPDEVASLSSISAIASALRSKGIGDG